MDNRFPLGEDPNVWYVLVCMVCNPSEYETPIIMPFTTAEERGKWASEHTKGTGHDKWFVQDQQKKTDVKRMDYDRG